jgi:predicted PurR-regulated permease PerM
VVAPFCTLLTLVVTGDVSTAALVLLVYSVVHFFEGNLFSPWLVGRHVDLNPLATLVAVIVGGELWGPVGMFLAVPVFGIIKIVCHAFSDTAWIAKLLGRIRPVKA